MIATLGMLGGGQPSRFTVIGSDAQQLQKSALVARRQIGIGDD
jgi:hypothetical protein